MLLYNTSGTNNNNEIIVVVRITTTTTITKYNNKNKTEIIIILTFSFICVLFFCRSSNKTKKNETYCLYNKNKKTCTIVKLQKQQ